VQRWPRRWRKAVDILQREGFAITERPTAAPGDATRLAREALEQGVEVVLVAGGDGTINEVLNGIAGTGVVLGALPGGTANVLCRELGLGTRWESAARALCRARPEPVAIGVVETADGAQRQFLCMAGVGLDAAVVRKVDPNLKRRSGKLAYYAASFALAGKRLAEFDAAFGGEHKRLSFLLASRVRNYGGDFTIARGASLRRGDFEVVGCEGSSSLRYFKYFAGVLCARLAQMKGVTVRAAEYVELRPVGEEPVYVQVDGELAGLLPARIWIMAEGVRLLIPPEYR